MNVNSNRPSIVAVLPAVTVMSGAEGKAAREINTDQSKPLPRVLLIGESITGGYIQGVRKNLDGEAFVHKNARNGADTRFALESLENRMQQKYVRWNAALTVMLTHTIGRDKK